MEGMHQGKKLLEYVNKKTSLVQLLAALLFIFSSDGVNITIKIAGRENLVFYIIKSLLQMSK